MQKKVPDESDCPSYAVEYWQIFREQTGEHSEVFINVESFLSEHGATILDFYLAAKFSDSSSLSYSLGCIPAMKRLNISETLYTEPYTPWTILADHVAYRDASGNFSLHPPKGIKLTAELARHAVSPYLTTSFGKIILIGSKPLISKSLSALSLLQEKDAPTLNLIEEYIGSILEWHRSGMAVDWTPPTFQMAADVFESSITWCASCIAHEANHSRLYREAITENPGGPVPLHRYSGRSVEMECLEVQRQVLRRIAAPIAELEYLASLDGSHADSESLYL